MAPAHEMKYLHALLCSGLEYDAIGKLDAAFGSYERAWRASASELADAGVAPEQTAALDRQRETHNPDQAMRELVTAGIALATAGGPGFPPELATIASPPRWLYIKGSIPAGPRLAVVGTRKASDYGREATRRIIEELAAETNVAIVSGLAQGIDAEAHRTALAERLASVGVLGSGMDRASLFPAENWNLAQDIASRGGGIVSEYPPGSPALKHHFPARNRIIAGLAAGTLVVEAPEKSGALITAHFALEQGREVFAVPGPFFSPSAAGVHRLIQDGAKLVTRAADIIAELGLAARPREHVALDAAGSGPEVELLHILEEPRSVDELTVATARPAPEILSTLTLLELKGLIRDVGAHRYQRTRG